MTTELLKLWCIEKKINKRLWMKCKNRKNEKFNKTNEKWKMKNEKWKMKNEKRKTKNEKQIMKH